MSWDSWVAPIYTATVAAVALVGFGLWIDRRQTMARRAREVEAALAPARSPMDDIRIGGQGDYKRPVGIVIGTASPWYLRCWRLLAFPYNYLIRGEIRL